MERSDLVFSCGPPLLAIILQIVGTPSSAALEAEAESARQAMNLPHDGKIRIQGSLSGAVAVANLTTTIVSSASGAFALLYTAHASPLFVYMAFAIALAFALLSSNLLNRSSYLDLVEKPLEAPSWIRMGRFLPFKRFHVIAAVIYSINGCLIALAFAFYFGLLKTTAT
jgi:hypothetical protein